MSEKDNLPKADGKKEAKPPKNEDVAVDTETVIEDTSGNITQVKEDTISIDAKKATNGIEAENTEPEEIADVEIETDTETEIKVEAIKKSIDEPTVEVETVLEDNTENIPENKWVRQIIASVFLGYSESPPRLSVNASSPL